jgi:GTP-binding protein
MNFIDSSIIEIRSGKGGNGHISFRKEKYVPLGGPDGGNGGRGGDIIFEADRQLTTLLDFRYQRVYAAEDGRNGGKSRCTGRSGKNLTIRVPAGTVIINDATDEILADLTVHGQQYTAAHGGRGGRGNIEFTTAVNQAPRYAEPGGPAEEFTIRLELKVLADVGIVGFPNAGKSTLISVISAARPKIADYPFTTLVPNLGMVYAGEERSFTVADIPGLIEGAHEGRGLGIQFLRHVERTNLLVFLIDAMDEDPVKQYTILCNELESYDPALLEKPRLLCLSKIDAIPEDELERLKNLDFGEPHMPVMLISAVAAMNTAELCRKMWEMLHKARMAMQV